MQTTESQKPERATNLWQKSSQPLDPILAPKTVAIIGATENAGSVGRTLIENMKQGSFPGKLYAVNPKRDTVLGLKAYPGIADIPDAIDLAVIVTPAPTVPL